MLVHVQQFQMHLKPVLAFCVRRLDHVIVLHMAIATSLVPRLKAWVRGYIATTQSDCATSSVRGMCLIHQTECIGVQLTIACTADFRFENVFCMLSVQKTRQVIALHMAIGATCM